MDLILVKSPQVLMRCQRIPKTAWVLRNGLTFGEKRLGERGSWMIFQCGFRYRYSLNQILNAKSVMGKIDWQNNLGLSENTVWYNKQKRHWNNHKGKKSKEEVSERRERKYLIPNFYGLGVWKSVDGDKTRLTAIYCCLPPHFSHLCVWSDGVEIVLHCLHWHWQAERCSTSWHHWPVLQCHDSKWRCKAKGGIDVG